MLLYFAWFAFLFTASNVRAAPSDVCTPIKAVSFNIRYGETGIQAIFDTNGWRNLQNPRRDRVFNSIRNLDSDVMGLQEVLSFQQAELTAQFSDYKLWGVGRDDGQSRGEAVPIAVRSSRFDVEEAGHFWLSETPDQPGTVFPGSATVRMASWVQVFDRECQRKLLIVNSHWDHVSQESRVASARLIRKVLESFPSDLGILVLGDLNASETNEAVES